VWTQASQVPETGQRRPRRLRRGVYLQGEHPLGEFRAEDFVLGLQVLDLPGQFGLAKAGEH